MKFIEQHGPITERQHILWKDQPQTRWFWAVLRCTSLGS